MKFEIADIPIKIDPCPIIEAIMELRFEANIPSGVIPGFVYQHFIADYSNLNKLPITEIPESIRDSDQNLMYAPLYYIPHNKNPNVRLQIGSRSLSLVCTNEYTGWTKFFELIKDVVIKTKNIGLIKKPERMGLRYVSFFENQNIFELLNGKYELGENPLAGQTSLIKTEFDYMSFICTAHIINKAVAVNGKNGSIIDLDVSKGLQDIPGVIEPAAYREMIDDAHKVEKKIFFSLLKDSFLKEKLHPQYNPRT